MRQSDKLNRQIKLTGYWRWMAYTTGKQMPNCLSPNHNIQLHKI